MRILPAASLVVPALLACVPARAAEDRISAQRRLCAAYGGAAREEIQAAREQLEVLQELSLTPHSADEPVESALLHLDLAEAHLAQAGPALAAAISTGAAPDGWTPFEERLEVALGLLRKTAPELAAVYDSVPVRLAPLEGKTVACYRRAQKAVELRGYYAVNGVSPEALAAWLAHEATHARESGKPEGAAESRERELAARRSQARVWKALGAPAAKDWASEHTDQLKALEAGDKAFRAYEHDAEETPPDWEWVKPQAAAAPASDAPQTDIENSTSGAVMVPRLNAFLAKTRANFADAAQAHLDLARERLGDIPELVVPQSRIVTFDVMNLWTLQLGRYPRPLYTAYQALSPAMSELAAARAALGRSAIDGAQRRLLESYRPQRAGPKPIEDKALALVRRYNRKAKRVLAAPYPGGEEPNDAIVVPGLWQSRAGRPEIAAAWAAHALAHRRQGLKPGQLPTAAQELEAVRASLGVWERSKADDGFENEHPDRFLRWRVADQAGGDVLETYLPAAGVPLSRP